MFVTITARRKLTASTQKLVEAYNTLVGQNIEAPRGLIDNLKQALGNDACEEWGYAEMPLPESGAVEVDVPFKEGESDVWIIQPADIPTNAILLTVRAHR